MRFQIRDCDCWVKRVFVVKFGHAFDDKPFGSGAKQTSSANSLYVSDGVGMRHVLTGTNCRFAWACHLPVQSNFWMWPRSSLSIHLVSFGAD